MVSAPLLEIRGIDYSYGRLQVLFGVHLDVSRGEVLALLGTNGAGKSTLLRAISGLGRVDRGTISFEGNDITHTDPARRVRLGIIQMPGGRAVFPDLTVAENLATAAYTYIWDRPKVAHRTAEALELFPVLRDHLHDAAGTLSGGEQQMLGLASAVMLDPTLLLIDELSIGLAPVLVQHLLNVVEQLRSKGVTIVLVEQSVNIALTIADRAVFMEKGEVRFEGPAGELLDRDDLVRAVFLGGVGG